MRRFTCLMNAFSKKLEKHAATVARRFMYCNVERVHQNLPVRRAAMKAGLADHVWSIEERAIAFGEYCFQVPANRIGYGEFTGYQLKIIQESVTLVVFAVFAYFYLGESIRWNYLASFGCLFAAVIFAFWGRP